MKRLRVGIFLCFGMLVWSTGASAEKPLLKAKQAGLLAYIRPDVARLRQQGFSISQRVVDAVLQQAGEA